MVFEKHVQGVDRIRASQLYEGSKYMRVININGQDGCASVTSIVTPMKQRKNQGTGSPKAEGD
jgi:hypothetical protein